MARQIQAVSAGPDQIRMYHPTLVVFDERGFLEGAEASFGASIPVAKKIIAVSTAAPSFFGEVCSRDDNRVSAKAPRYLAGGQDQEEEMSGGIR